MTDTTLNAPTVLSRKFPGTYILLLFVAFTLLNGCSARKKPAIAWSTAILVRPVQAPKDAHSVSAELDPAPELKVELIAPPRLAMTRVSPPRPRGVSPAAGGGENNAADVPLLTPQLSTQETANAQREANASIGIAEKNLAAIHNRKLSAAQADLASKARGFLADARDAARTLDWDSARTLAKKAQVLSQELVSTF
jgi:hypothetical protein